MSDQSQGPGWWQATDGKWYSPEQHPDYRPPVAPPQPPPAPAPTNWGPPPGPAATGPGHSPKAQAAAAKAAQKADRPWWKKKRFVIPLVLIALVVIGGALGSGGDDDPDQTADDDDTEQTDPQQTDDTEPDGTDDTEPENSDVGDADEVDDVTIDACNVEFGFVTAPMTIVNNSSDTSNYIIEFQVLDGSGTRVGEGIASANNVSEGQTAKEDGAGSLSGEPSGPFTCELTRVERYSSS